MEDAIVKHLSILFAVFAILSFHPGTPNAQTAARADFDGSGKPEISDVVFMLAWVQTGSTDAAVVGARAKEIYSVLTANPTSLPASTIDDLNGDGKVDINDVVMTLAWVQTESADPTTLLNRAMEIFSGIAGAISAFPNVKVTR